MPDITYHVVIPFTRDADDNLAPMQPAEAPSAESACSRARIAAMNNAGALAFSRTGDPQIGEFADAVILASFGDVDQALLEGGW